MSTRAAGWAGVQATSPGVVLAGVTHGLAQRSYLTTWKGTLASLKIGGEEMKNFQLRFGDIDLADGSEMLIGADFFLSIASWCRTASTRCTLPTTAGRCSTSTGRCLRPRPAPPRSRCRRPQLRRTPGLPPIHRTRLTNSRAAPQPPCRRGTSQQRSPAGIKRWRWANDLAMRAAGDRGDWQPRAAVDGVDQAGSSPDRFRRLARGDICEREPTKPADERPPPGRQGPGSVFAVATAYERVGCTGRRSPSSIRGSQAIRRRCAAR